MNNLLFQCLCKVLFRNLNITLTSTVLSSHSRVSNKKNDPFLYAELILILNSFYFYFQHGRLKVRTSEEEAARKKKEQELKVIAYRKGMFKIKEKRLLDEYDDELMQITASILSKNPDLFTLWNIRRECILLMNEKQPSAELFDKDLNFTENCLLVNPKSYCAWHHRCWILEHSPEPKWQREVDMCTKYLKMDERNCKLNGSK